MTFDMLAYSSLDPNLTGPAPIEFFLHGADLELGGKLFCVGELTEDILNLTVSDYQPIDRATDAIMAMAEDFYTIDPTKEESLPAYYEQWQKLNAAMEQLRDLLRPYKVFAALFELDAKLFAETAAFLADPDPSGDFRLDHQLGRAFYPFDEIFGHIRPENAPPDWPESEDWYQEALRQGAALPVSDDEEMPEIFREGSRYQLVYPGNLQFKQLFYVQHVLRYVSYVDDLACFLPTVHNFTNLLLKDLPANSPANYAAKLYDLFYDDRLAGKLIPLPTRRAMRSYSPTNQCSVAFTPRILPGQTEYSICTGYITTELQFLLKADYIQTLTLGWQIRRCLCCQRYFLIKSGVHALYCEGVCPHNSRYNCRQFGSVQIQKELARDNPKIREKERAIGRIRGDKRRGNISEEAYSTAGKYIQQALYEALRSQDISVDAFAQAIAKDAVYRACGITHEAGKPGRPARDQGGDST